jgi:TonB family protein
VNSQIESYYRWDEPDTNLTVFLKPETVDRLQAAALAGNGFGTQAGQEMGGILLGWTEANEDRTLIVVEEFEPVVCEHCNGRSYSLSDRDAAIFEEVITRGKSRRVQVVGYYRSHKRRGLFLSPDDLALIHRHFPNPENVFLLIKPLPNGACTAGFFFWKDGHIPAEFTGSEVPLIPMAASPACDEQPKAAAPASSPPLEIRPPLAPTAQATHLSPRRIARYVFIGLSLAATAAVLTHRAPRPAARRDARAVPANAERALPRLLSHSEQPALIAPSLSKPSTRREQPQALPVPQKAGEATSATSRPFVLPSRNSRPPAEPAAGSEPPVAAPGPILPKVPAISEPVVGNPTAPPAQTPRAANTAAANSAATAVPHTFTASRVIHQVKPAVPRGVGPEITSDVQVDVEVTIDSKGKVTGARVASTKGAAADLLTIEALKAAQLFRFQPAEDDGRAVPAVTILTFRFAPAIK